MPKKNIFSVAFQIQDIQWNPDSATALPEFCHLLLTWISKTLISHILCFSSPIHHIPHAAFLRNCDWNCSWALTLPAGTFAFPANCVKLQLLFLWLHYGHCTVLHCFWLHKCSLLTSLVGSFWEGVCCSFWEGVYCSLSQLIAHDGSWNSLSQLSYSHFRKLTTKHVM